MKLLLIVCVFAFFALSCANPPEQSRGCIIEDGKCKFECPEGTHLYKLLPNQPLHFEATCEDPVPENFEVFIEGYSDCYCDPPTIRHADSGKCITPDKCPKKEK